MCDQTADIEVETPVGWTPCSAPSNLLESDCASTIRLWIEHAGPLGKSTNSAPQNGSAPDHYGDSTTESYGISRKDESWGRTVLASFQNPLMSFSQKVTSDKSSNCFRILLETWATALFSPSSKWCCVTPPPFQSTEKWSDSLKSHVATPAAVKAERRSTPHPLMQMDESVFLLFTAKLKHFCWLKWKIRLERVAEVRTFSR